MSKPCGATAGLAGARRIGFQRTSENHGHGRCQKVVFLPRGIWHHIFSGIAAGDVWCFSIFILYIGMRFLNFNNRWTRYGQEAIVAFYMFHQPIILAIGFYVVQWSTTTWIKMLVVISSSFFITTALYELLVRRLPPLRSVFGMKASPTRIE